MKALFSILAGLLLLLVPGTVQALPVPEWLARHCKEGPCYPNPLLPEPDEAAFAILREEINRLNTLFYPVERLGWCYTAPRHLNKRPIALEERVERLNAQVILRERDPRKVQRDLDRLRRELHTLLGNRTRALWKGGARYAFEPPR